MKRVDLLISHEHLDEDNELHKHNVGVITFYDVRGRGRTSRISRTWQRTIRRVPEFPSGTKIEVIVADSLVKAVMNDILNILREGSFASGKIFVSDIMEAHDIETKETGEAAL
jgi:nitrogen regulatory protein P-II 1